MKPPLCFECQTRPVRTYSSSRCDACRKKAAYVPKGRKHLRLKGPGHQIISRGYTIVYFPSHPIAMKNGYVAEHRMVLYDHLGPGRVRCWWCKKRVSWSRSLTVDHLNWDTQDNDVENLVVACRRCNARRKEGRYLI